MIGSRDKYPDLSDIHARKARARREPQPRTFGKKIAIVEDMRKRLAPLKRAREAAQASQRSGGNASRSRS